MRKPIAVFEISSDDEDQSATPLTLSAAEQAEVDKSHISKLDDKFVLQAYDDVMMEEEKEVMHYGGEIFCKVKEEMEATHDGGDEVFDWFSAEARNIKEEVDD